MSFIKINASKVDFGNVLSSNPPIVGSILKNLNWRDLEQCAEVCNLWKRIVKTEGNRRKGIFSFCRATDVIFKSYPSIGEFLAARGSGSHNENSYKSRRVGIIRGRNEVIKELTTLKLHPYFCLVFTTAEFVDSFDYLFSESELLENEKHRRENVWDILVDGNLNTGMEIVFRKFLPDQCKFSCCVATGIAGRYNGSIPFEIVNDPAISGIILPHCPGMKIYTFGFKCEILKMIPQDLNIKCLLMFGNINYSHVNREVQKCLQKENSNIAIGGMSHSSFEIEKATFVAFCGENIDAASIVIEENDNQKAVEDKLKLFKKSGLVNNSCFVVIFSYIGSGIVSRYKETEDLASTFHKLYPKIPVTGICGQTQIGLDYVPNVPVKKKSFFRDRLPATSKPTRYSHATVFVLISIKGNK